MTILLASFMMSVALGVASTRTSADAYAAVMIANAIAALLGRVAQAATLLFALIGLCATVWFLGLMLRELWMVFGLRIYAVMHPLG